MAESFPPTRYVIERVHRWAIALQRAAALFRQRCFTDLYFGPSEQLDADRFPGFQPAVLYWVATAERERLTYALPLSALGLTFQDLPSIAPAVIRRQAEFLEDCRRLWEHIRSDLPGAPTLDVAALGEIAELPSDWLARFNAATGLARRRPADEETWAVWCELALVARTAQSVETIRAALTLAELDARTDLTAVIDQVRQDFGRRLNEFFFVNILSGVADAPRTVGERLGRNGVFAEHDLSKTHIQPLKGLLTVVGSWLGGPPLVIETTIRTCSFQEQTRVVLAAEGKSPALGRHLCTLCAAFDQTTLDAVLPSLLAPRSRLHAALGWGDAACRFTAELGARSSPKSSTSSALSD
ncbi:MAG: hypothetical protein NZ585_02150 [Chloracidobacterium sp.]|nr:hypothetical protein [Chloracidobacterium sp.]MDW8218671.1 hypothetical protein [Acidobacteriota bacterium]